MIDVHSCALCGAQKEVAYEPSPHNRMLARIVCPTCGEYTIHVELYFGIGMHLTQEQIHTLSCVARDYSERKIPVTITRENALQLVESAHVPDSPLESMDRIMLYVFRHSATADSHVCITNRDYTIAFCKTEQEFGYLLNMLVELGFLENPGNGMYRLTIKGWQRVAELRKSQLEGKSNQAFVAMWFDPKMNESYTEGFAPALLETGYTPVRIDKVEHNDKIDDRIIAEIRNSALLVADFTGHRGGVYFEAGFAMGIGLPVIWTCHESDIDNAHFDTRQYNHIVWTTPLDLREKLTNRIKATLPRT